MLNNQTTCTPSVVSIISFALSFTFEGCHVGACAIEEFSCARVLEIYRVFWNTNVTCQLSFLRLTVEREVLDEDKVFLDIRV